MLEEFGDVFGIQIQEDAEADRSQRRDGARLPRPQSCVRTVMKIAGQNICAQERRRDAEARSWVHQPARAPKRT